MSWPAERTRIRLQATLLWGVASVCSLTAAGAQSQWSLPISAGYDIYLHDYYLAESDTTEVIQELNIAANLNGASAWGAKHRWYLRAGLSGGTELFRESLDTGLRLRTDTGHEWARADLLVLARQFREDSEYSLSSNNHESRLLAALSPWSSDHVAVDLRARGRYVRYENPSTLEVDYNDGAVGAYLRAPRREFRSWTIGGSYSGRDYPDSSAINREGFILEGDYDHGSLDRTFRVFHRSERRNIEDETARPSAWFHWSDLDTANPAGDNTEVILRASSEVWDYDEATGAWYDSWLVGGAAGGRWGSPLRTRFEMLVTGELLDAGEEPETYWQGGIRFGADSMVGRLTGSASIELGRRWYSNDINTTDVFVLAYSDYNYLAFWIMANWMINEHFSTDLSLNYEPESHTEQDDNRTLGFASLRLVWRP